ncbi:polycystin-1-related protein [Lycorma delicatula]|uniref:polycystin-1-related protein n=1 Tax=Lycorma delicatula TaxID=130591 RepID=UPI003F5148E8
MIPDYDIMMNEYLIVNRIKDTHIIDFQANQDSNSLCYIGILPGPKEKENNFVKYEFKISKIDCYVWTDIYTWVPGYCNVVVARDTARSVYCQCKHFSGFTISSYPPSVWAVNVRDTFVNVDKIKNRFVGLFLLALLSLFIIFAILVYFLDRKDDFAAKVIILEDNIPGYRYPYLIGVYTGNRISGGTSATVGLQIYGKRGKSKVHVLKCSYRKVLTRGSDDWFIIFTKLSLGLLKYLHVWADFHGNNPSWFCSKIVVIDIDKNKEYVFILDEWLTIYLKEDAVLTHELSVADETEINSGAFITKYNTAIAIREGHIWSGLLCRHPRSNFRRVQRLGVLLFMVFSLSTVIFYFESDMFRKKTLDLPSFTAFDEDVMFKCILSLCIVLPFVFLLSYCFKKSTAANYYNTKEYAKKTKCFVPRSTEDLDNYSKNVQFISTLLMLQPLQPIVITDKENYVRKRRNKWTLIAWIAIAICVSIEFSILLYFGHNFPLRRSFKWILTTLFANCLSVFVIEPTILLFSSMILGYVLGVSQKESTILLHNEHKVKSYNDKLLSDGEFIEELYEIRSQYCYEPLAVKKERLSKYNLLWCDVVESTLVNKELQNNLDTTKYFPTTFPITTFAFSEQTKYTHQAVIIEAQ